MISISFPSKYGEFRPFFFAKKTMFNLPEIVPFPDIKGRELPGKTGYILQGEYDRIGRRGRFCTTRESNKLRNYYPPANVKM
jgi:hypothetical protein